MNIEMDFNTFCKKYYKDARQFADITIAEQVKNNGPLNPYIDVDLVKDLGISYGLEKVYSNFDVDHESHATIKTYISKVIHNCVLTELGKETTAVGAKKRNRSPIDFMRDAGTFGNKGFGGFRDYIESGQKFEKKEDLIAQMIQCIKKMSGVDQVVLTCWMNYPKGQYTEMVLDELQWEDNKLNRNIVNVRLIRATERLRKMMAGARSDYRDIYASPAQKQPDQIPVPRTISNVYYNFIRRRRRAAKKSISGRIDYVGLVQTLTANIPD